MIIYAYVYASSIAAMPVRAAASLRAQAVACYCGSFRVDSSDKLVRGGWDAHAELVRSSRDAAGASVKRAKNGTTVGPRA